MIEVYVWYELHVKTAIPLSLSQIYVNVKTAITEVLVWAELRVRPAMS